MVVSNPILTSPEKVTMPEIQSTPTTDRWPQRALFKRYLKLLAKKEGLTMTEVAEKLGTTYNTLRQYISVARKDTRPSLEFIQRAAALFECSVTEFIDNPGEPMQGLALANSEEERVFLREVAHDIATLAPEKRRLLAESWPTILRLLNG